MTAGSPFGSPVTTWVEHGSEKDVELRGFEPRTSCMPSSGRTSTAVHLCRSPSQDVPARPPESRPVAVLSCCTALPTRMVLAAATGRHATSQGL
jgi:hypothetical protein